MVDARLFEFDKSMVRSRLLRWGEWKMKSGVGLGFHDMSSFMRLGGGSDRNHDSYGDIDSDCVLTNKSVDMLPLFPKEAIRVEYVYCYRDSAVKAHACGISKRSYYNYLDQAHDLVAKNLNYLLHSVHETDINLLNVHQCV